jgi:hypothetical protein
MANALKDRAAAEVDHFVAPWLKVEVLISPLMFEQSWIIFFERDKRQIN